MTTAAIIHMGMRKPIFTSRLIAPFSGVLFYRFIADMQLHRRAYICQTLDPSHCIGAPQWWRKRRQKRKTPHRYVYGRGVSERQRREDFTVDHLG